jgi:hypothetical protein
MPLQQRSGAIGNHIINSSAAALPAPYPVTQSIVANLVALVGMREGRGHDFVRAAYRRWFQSGEETGSEPNVSSSLRDVGQEETALFRCKTSQ